VDDPVPSDPLDDADEDPAEAPDDAVPPSTPDGTGTTVGSLPTDPATTGTEALPYVVRPVLLDPLLMNSLLVDRLLLDRLLLDRLREDRLIADPLLADPAALPVDATAVDPASVEVVAVPVPCSEPDVGAVVTADIGAVRDARLDRQAGVRGRSATTGSLPAPMSTDGSAAPAAIASPGGAPAAPPSPPAPVSLPVPLPTPVPAGPAGPAGSAATASSGTSCYGAGQTDDADRIDAVLGARITASLAQAAQRPTSGFAGGVIGDAMEPGVSPG
jgi:hypothetical protein